MDDLLALWLPILLSAAAAFVASAVIWMALPHHKSDYSSLPDENGFIAHLRAIGLKPGNYCFPNTADHSRMKDPEVQRCWKEGPVGFITLIRTPPNMGRNMAICFIVNLIVSICIAYVGSLTLDKGADFKRVFQVLGTVGVLSYAFAHIPNGVWFGAKRSTIINCIIDGVVYGLITGAIFAALWPR